MNERGRYRKLAADPRTPWIIVGVLCIIGPLQNVYLSGFTGQPGPLWKVWIYELSSCAVLLVLIPFVAWSAGRFSILDRTARSIFMQLCASVVFSVIHVASMVAIRKGVFALLGQLYDFGPPLRGFAYEYGKDFFAYWIFLGVFTVSQWLRESTARQAEAAESRERQGFTVKTARGNVFVPFAALVHVESSGNYVTFHTSSGEFLHRATMKDVAQVLPAEDFARTHRSHLVRLSAIRGIRSRPDGEKLVELSNGRRIPLSRTYASARDWTVALVGITTMNPVESGQ